MDIFKLRPEDDDCIKLKEENFHRATGKQYPYFQEKGGRTQHYATCPACDNPIHIINLDVDEKYDSLGRKLSLFAKHAKSDVRGVAKFVQEEYDDCPLANPEAFTGRSKRVRGKTSAELIEFLIEFSDVVEMVIRSATGVQFTEEAFERMLRAFRAEEGYLYRHTTKFNLPYGVLYMAKHQSIVDSRVADRSKIRNAIEASSEYFYVNRAGKVLPKTGCGRADIGFFLTKHVIPSDAEIPQTMAMVVEERLGESRRGVAEIVVEIDQTYFNNTIAKRRRFRRMAEAIFR